MQTHIRSSHVRDGKKVSSSSDYVISLHAFVSMSGSEVEGSIPTCALLLLVLHVAAMPAALALLALLVGLTMWTGLGGATESPALRLRQESGDVSGPEVQLLVSERENTADYSGEASWRRESSDSRGGRRAGMQGRSPLCGDPRPPTVPGLEQILRGYNVYTAAPLSDKGYDPGFQGNLIFRESYERQATTGDCAYSEPDGLELVSQPVCSLNFASAIVIMKK